MSCDIRADLQLFAVEDPLGVKRVVFPFDFLMADNFRVRKLVQDQRPQIPFFSGVVMAITRREPSCCQ
jgi:hypothetical protein